MEIEKTNTPILFPYEPAEFWDQIRKIIREEVDEKSNKKSSAKDNLQTEGLTYKPLFKMREVCSLLQVTRPTIYDWIKLGKLHPYKIRSRVYFLWNDIQKLLPFKD